MGGGSDVRSAAGFRFATLPWVALTGFLYGLAEFVRQRWIAPSPAGIPGDAGGDVLGYVALGVTVFALPALIVLVAARGRRWAPWLAWTVAFAPTLALFVGRVVALRRLEWGLDVEGTLRWAPILALATLVAAVLATVFTMLQRRLPGGRLAISLAFVATAIAPGLLLLRLGIASPDWPADPRENRRPNLVLLTIDTLRADAVNHVTGAWPAPGIDRRVVTNTWANSSWTRPAMASFFSGVVPTGHGADGERAPATDVAWFVEDLRAAGYRTMAVVSNPHLRRRFGFDRGFSLYEHHGELEWLEPIARSFWAEWWLERFGGESDDATADRLVPRAEAVLDHHAHGGPWLLWVHLMDPHIPYHLRGPDGAVRDEDPGAWIDPLRPAMDGDLFDALWPTREGVAVTTPEARAALRRLYQTEVDYALHWSARLLRAAARASGTRDLLWVMTSDHGEEFWDDGGYEHGHTLHPSVTEVPLWIGGTRAVDGANAPRRLIDVGPWLLEEVGVAGTAPRSGSGLLAEDLDLAPFALGRAESTREILAEGTLYGPPRTWLRWPDGATAARRDDTRAVELGASAADTVDADERAKALFIQLDLWRERNASKGRAVDLSPDLVRQLQAIGYVQ